MNKNTVVKLSPEELEQALYRVLWDEVRAAGWDHPADFAVEVAKRSGLSVWVFGNKVLQRDDEALTAGEWFALAELLGSSLIAWVERAENVGQVSA